MFDGWVVGAVFVCSVSAWYMMKKRRREFALDSIRIAGWVGLVGILLTLWTGDGSAVQVARVQPMKLAAMEGLYKGKPGQGNRRCRNPQSIKKAQRRPRPLPV